MIVSVHPLANDPFLHALGKRHPPFITVVTDLVTTHAMWYGKDVYLCLVPTEAARQRGLLASLKAEQLEVVGMPGAARFCQPPVEKSALRQQLGWPLDVPIVLLAGGGEGMGPLEKTALAISKANLPIALVVVTGRNMELKNHLKARQWPMPTFIYVFVNEMRFFIVATIF